MCLQPPLVGDCTTYTERYHFDPYEGRCKSFVYSGCGGNSNNFIAIDDCRNKCENSYVPQPIAGTDQAFNVGEGERIYEEQFVCEYSRDLRRAGEYSPCENWRADFGKRVRSLIVGQFSRANCSRILACRLCANFGMKIVREYSRANCWLIFPCQLLANFCVPIVPVYWLAEGCEYSRGL
jgi:hypothetical protein